MKRIVILPIFNEAHFLPYFIKNVKEVIEPDLIIMNEGMFPRGPESRGVNDRYIKEFTYNGDGKRSFDIEEVREIVKEHSNVTLNEMEYGDITTQEAYVKAFTHGIPDDLQADAAVFLTEADVFIHEGDKTLLNEIVAHMPNEEVITAAFLRFFISPFVRILPNKERRIVLKYGDGSLLHKVASDNFLDSYLRRYATHCELRVFHYEWIRPGKYYFARRGQFDNKFKRNPLVLEMHDRCKEQIDAHGKIKQEWPLSLETNKNIDHPTHFRGHPEYQRFSSTH